MQRTPCVQAQQAAAIHAKQAQQARAELEEVRRRAADSIRASSASTAQLRELGELRARLVDAEFSTAGSAHELQACRLIPACQSLCLRTLSSTLICTRPYNKHSHKPSCISCLGSAGTISWTVRLLTAATYPLWMYHISLWLTSHRELHAYRQS